VKKQGIGIKEGQVKGKTLLKKKTRGGENFGGKLLTKTMFGFLAGRLVQKKGLEATIKGGR